jgi:hypothetical protein
LPPAIGVLLPLAGAAYLPNLWPPLVTAIRPVNLVLALGEFVLVVWLLAHWSDFMRGGHFAALEVPKPAA